MGERSERRVRMGQFYSGIGSNRAKHADEARADDGDVLTLATARARRAQIVV